MLIRAYRPGDRSAAAPLPHIRHNFVERR